jgi:hypothetical protein
MKTFQKMLLSENTTIAESYLDNEKLKIDLCSKLPKYLRPFGLEVEALEGLRWSEVDKLIIEAFQFPSASKDFNLEAMSLTTAYADLQDFWQKSSYAFGTKSLTAERIEAIREEQRIYTTSEKQNEAYELARDLVSNLNKAKDMGLIALPSELFHYRTPFTIKPLDSTAVLSLEMLLPILQRID